jgi:RHS repeat-associated protein
MESAPIQALYEPPLAAKPQLREKPHQGPSSKNQAWHQGPSVCKFTVTLGLRATVVENGVGQTYSARYYNPNTGRFLSRDPENGILTDPASLHKYLYANGDPVNRVDPSGRGAYEYGLQIGIMIGRAAVAVAAVGCVVNAIWEGIDVVVEYASKYVPGAKKFPAPPPPLKYTCVALGAYWGVLYLSGLFFGVGG